MIHSHASLNPSIVLLEGGDPDRVENQADKKIREGTTPVAEWRGVAHVLLLSWFCTGDLK